MTHRVSAAAGPWSERHSYVITAGVVAAVALVLWIIVPGLKREIANNDK
jgi:hypothetical protein